MKNTFQGIYKSLKHCSHVPDQYYGHILTLAGMVYNNETDKEIEHDLKQLSLTYDNISNSTLGRIKEIVHEIVFWTKPDRENRLPDIEHLIREHRNAPLEQINTLIVNLTQLYSINNTTNNTASERVKIVADFTSLINELQQLLKNIKSETTNDFNISKILGFITLKGIEKGFITENETLND